MIPCLRGGGLNLVMPEVLRLLLFDFVTTTIVLWYGKRRFKFVDLWNYLVSERKDNNR